MKTACSVAAYCGGPELVDHGRRRAVVDRQQEGRAAVSTMNDRLSR